MLRLSRERDAKLTRKNLNDGLASFDKLKGETYDGDLDGDGELSMDELLALRSTMAEREQSDEQSEFSFLSPWPPADAGQEVARSSRVTS